MELMEIVVEYRILKRVVKILNSRKKVRKRKEYKQERLKWDKKQIENNGTV